MISLIARWQEFQARRREQEEALRQWMASLSRHSPAAIAELLSSEGITGECWSWAQNPLTRKLRQDLRARGAGVWAERIGFDIGGFGRLPYWVYADTTPVLAAFVRNMVAGRYPQLTKVAAA